MKVKAGKDLEFWCQGKKVTENNVIRVSVNHDIQKKLNNGSLVEIRASKEKKGGR